MSPEYLTRRYSTKRNLFETDAMHGGSPLVSAGPSYARKLLRDLAAWSQSIGFAPHRDSAAVQRSDAAMSAIDLNRISGSSFEGMKPRRRQNAAASTSIALTISARPPIRPAAVTQRCSVCLSRPVPILAASILICRELSQQAGRGPDRAAERSGSTAAGAMARLPSARGHNSR